MNVLRMKEFCRQIRNIFRGLAPPTTNAFPCNELIHCSSFILQLPTELIFAIAEVLQHEDVVAMSLSCRALYRIFPYPRTKAWTSGQKQNLLLRLERDLGRTHSFCSSCNALHPFSKDPREQVFQENRRPSCNTGKFFPLFTWTRGSRGLGYQTARLLMNSHRYGPQYGLPLEVFCLGDPSTHSESLEYPRWRVRIEGKFVDNNLLLKATHALKGSDLGQMLRTKAVVNHPLCSHVVALEGKIDGGGWTRRAAVSLEAQGPSPTTKGCQMCLTDWNFEVGKQGNDISVVLTTYHLAGSASNHLDTTWLLLTGRDWQLLPGEAQRLLQRHPRGTLSTLWEAAASSE